MKVGTTVKLKAQSNETAASHPRTRKSVQSNTTCTVFGAILHSISHNCTYNQLTTRCHYTNKQTAHGGPPAPIGFLLDQRQVPDYRGHQSSMHRLITVLARSAATDRWLASTCFLMTVIICRKYGVLITSCTTSHQAVHWELHYNLIHRIIFG